MNLNIFILGLQILCFTQNDRVEGKQKIAFGQAGGNESETKNNFTEFEACRERYNRNSLSLSAYFF